MPTHSGTAPNNSCSPGLRSQSCDASPNSQPSHYPGTGRREAAKMDHPKAGMTPNSTLS